MSNYVIYTDSACDISPELLHRWGVYSSPLTFCFEGDCREYTDGTMATAEFYKRMRAGEVARTSAVNAATFQTEFEKLLKQGLDILYFGISSTLSSTYQSASMAAEQLREHYPERKILIVDSLSVSAGQALLLKLVSEKQADGATIEEAAAYAEQIRLNICHWITVDDLIYLKRGGRLSSTSALVGKALGIKPLLHLNDEGKLVGAEKVRGRRKAIEALADKYTTTAKEAADGKFFIFHSECRDAAEKLVQTLKERHPAIEAMISDINAVIGTHVGPGSLFCAFVGSQR